MLEEIIKSQCGAVRIHSSGDFYSRQYLSKWLTIADALPHVHFYAYTKSVDMLKQYDNVLPDNMTIIYSFGGTQDHLINTEVDRHARVFEKGTMPMDYAYANNNDHIALANNHKIGLINH
jgi:hypothetical protein